MPAQVKSSLSSTDIIFNDISDNLLKWKCNRLEVNLLLTVLSLKISYQSHTAYRNKPAVVGNSLWKVITSRHKSAGDLGPGLLIRSTVPKHLSVAAISLSINIAHSHLHWWWDHQQLKLTELWRPPAWFKARATEHSGSQTSRRADLKGWTEQHLRHILHKGWLQDLLIFLQ